MRCIVSKTTRVQSPMTATKANAAMSRRTGESSITASYRPQVPMRSRVLTNSGDERGYNASEPFE
jgi:hypothetical protein